MITTRERRRMKTSVKIIITAGGFLLALAITSMVVFERDVGAKIRDRIAAETYRLHNDHAFNAVEIFSGWEVEISQDTTCTIDVVGGNTQDNSLVSVENGILRFGKAADQKSGMYKRARIVLPVLNYLSADSGTVIRVNGFKSDSIAFRLADGSRLNGVQNQFETMIVESASSFDFTMEERKEK